MKKLLTAATFGAIFLPAVAFAQGQVAGNNLTSLIRWFGEILNMLIPIFIALALLAFFWGLIMYVWKTDTEQGKKVMIAGIVALFVMVSVWGIIRLAQNTLGINSGGALPAPEVPQR